MHLNLLPRELMIPLASGEADEQNIPTSQNVSICLTFLGTQLNFGLVQLIGRGPNSSSHLNNQRPQSQGLQQAGVFGADFRLKSKK